MNAILLIAELSQYDVPPDLMAAIAARLVLGEQALNRVAGIRQQNAERQRRKRSGEAVTLPSSRESRDPSRPSPNGPPDPLNTPPLPSQDQKTGERLHEDWTPSEEDRDYAKREGWSDEKIAAGAENFLDYWRSVIGENAISCDWSARWRYHVRNWPPKVLGRERLSRRSRPINGTVAVAMDAAGRIQGWV